MLNQIILVAKVVKLENDMLFVKISQKDTEDITTSVILKNEMIDNVRDYVKINDIVGIKGHLISDGIQCDKLTFLSSARD